MGGSIGCKQYDGPYRSVEEPPTAPALKLPLLVRLITSDNKLKSFIGLTLKVGYNMIAGAAVMLMVFAITILIALAVCAVIYGLKYLAILMLPALGVSDLTGYLILALLVSVLIIATTYFFVSLYKEEKNKATVLRHYLETQHKNQYQ